MDALCIQLCGTIDDVDKDMNVLLRNVIRKDLFLPIDVEQKNISIESCYVNGSIIRYVHLQPKVNVNTNVSNYIKKLDKIKKKGPNKFKVSADQTSTSVETGKGAGIAPARKRAEEIIMTCDDKSDIENSDDLFLQ